MYGAGFGLVDGFGVTGGTIGVLVVAPLVAHLTPLETLLPISSFRVVAALPAGSPRAPVTRALEEVSP